MKKTITLLWMVFFMNIYLLQAQTNLFYEMLYPMSGTVGAKMPHISLIYGHPLVVTQMADTVQTGLWINKQKIVSPKDAHDRFTRFTSYNWDSMKWKPGAGFDYTFSYVYSAQGKLLQYNRIQRQTDTVNMREDMTYTFNGPSAKPSQGNAVDSIISTHLAIPYGGRIDSFLYAGSDLAEFSSYRIQGSVKSLDRKWRYTYDASGLTLSWIDHVSNGSGGINPIAKEEYTYNSGGQVSQILNYTYTSGSFLLKRKQVFTYVGTTDRMSKMEEYKWDAGTSAYTLSNDINFNYDANNKLSFLIAKDYTVANGASDMKADATYNPDGSPKLVLFYKANGSGWATNAYSRYIYTDTSSNPPVLAPTITLGPNPQSCSGNAASLSYVATTNNPTHYSITWNPADTLLGMKNVSKQTLTTSPIALPFKTFVNAGVFNGQISVSNGSGSNSYSFQLTVVAAPSLQIAALTPIQKGDTIHYLRYTNVQGSPTQYALNFFTDGIAQGFSHINSAPLSPDSLLLKIPASATAGTYNALFYVWNQATCQSKIDTLHFVILEATGIAHPENELEFSLFPNPANNEISLHSKETILYTELYDLTGKLQLSTQESIMDLSSLPAGIYIVRAHGRNASISRKLVKN